MEGENSWGQRSISKVELKGPADALGMGSKRARSQRTPRFLPDNSVNRGARATYGKKRGGLRGERKVVVLLLGYK